jgi:hypothetical protein
MRGESVAFEILLRSAGSGRRPTVRNIDQFRPDPESLELVRRWLIARGVDAHATEFGIACSAPPALFEKIFAARPLPAGPASPEWRLDGSIRIPAEIAAHVEDVTLSQRPEWL